VGEEPAPGEEARVRLNPFLRGEVWWARIPRLEKASVQRSLDVRGKENRDVAVEVCTFLKWLKGRRESFLLDVLAAGRERVGTAYTAYTENRLDQFIIELREGVKDVDLEPFVAKWQKELERRKKPNAQTRAKYLRQVRTLIPAGQPFRRSQFTKQRVRDWLDSLGVGQPNRYRAALSSLAEFLLFEDAIAVNPVRQVKMSQEAEPRTKHLIQSDAKKLLDAFADDRFAAFHALMLATGMEFSAARRLDGSTVTSDSVYAAGSKTVHRQRTCTIYKRWRWAWDRVLAFLATRPESAHPFAWVDVWRSRSALRAALKAAKLDETYTQHDHRHTWAVQAIRDGIQPHTIAYQLGHRDATMLSKVYGRYRPQTSDFESNATNRATATAEAER
jgi:integrase